MTLTVESVHPSVTLVSIGERQLELPTAAFPTPPKVKQTWTLSLTHLPSTQEQFDQLNDYLKGT